MSDGVSIDTSQVRRLAVDLASSGPRVLAGARAVVIKTTLEVERGMKRDFTGHRYAPLIPRAIDHTIRGLSAEIGVNKAGPQGGLGNILAFGTAHNGPVVDHTAALRAEAPKFEKYLLEVGVASIE